MDSSTSFKVYNASAGSGKTFTLVKEYLKIILSDPDFRLYQHILAITFTNKAASEMKDRILENLLDFSIASESDRSNDMLSTVVEETGLDQEVIQKRAKERLQDILKNYASFHIKTIDSFTNKLIKSFAFDLGLSTDFEVELDTDAILQEAVDGVLARIGIDQELTKLLVSFSKEKTLEDKSWDISKDLFEVSKLILNENHSRELVRLSDKSLSSFSDLSKRLRKQQAAYIKEITEKGEAAIALIDAQGIDMKDFYRGQFPKFFLKMINDPPGLDFDKENSLSRNIRDRNFYGKSKPEKVKLSIDGISDELITFYSDASKLFEKYKLNELILKNLVPLAVINAINQALEEIKTNNNIRLNAEFNQLISDHLINEPAAFIYEKLGERFKYFFIDEMQDTSVLQWNNLIPLIDNALSAESAGLMLVGDAKQAIYRWRGGRAEQFISLSSDSFKIDANPFQAEKSALNLDTNYRSLEEIVKFNNDFFSHIASNFGNKTYDELYRLGNAQKINHKKGGFVSLQFMEAFKNNEEREEHYPRVVLETLTKLLNQYQANEICILVRKKKEGAAVAKFLTEQGVPIVSSETLQIQNNRKIGFIINLMRIIEDDKNEDAKFEILYFLHIHLGVKMAKHEFIKQFVKKEGKDFFRSFEAYNVFYSPDTFNEYSILEGVEDLIRCFRLTAESDAFIQFFLDFVFDYTQRKSQKSSSFLEFWEEKKDRLNIVNSEDVKAVRIMTIHKSKGLEFPVVIYPFDLDIYYERDPKAWFKDLDGESFHGFDSILVNSSTGIKKTGESGTMIYEEQEKEKELDSYNLLYVCLTRAIEQLYIISEIKKSGKALGTSSQLFVDFLKQQHLWDDNKLSYEFGNMERLSKPQRSKSEAVFQEEFISSSWKDHQIHIVANSELLWDQTREEAIGYGNLIHELMEMIIDEEDIESAIERTLRKGLIQEESMAEIRRLVVEIVRHPLLDNYFKKGAKVLTEREILTDSGQLIIPDRLVFEGDKVTIIDYKTGSPNENHKLQIDNYAQVLQKLNYEVANRILVYIDDKITVVKR
ncbi:UvrD-helicase domain-containing protein [Lutimonas sp.]|uniref:UvrD-helicase domain-containing protein n=1 Tax=Lutimonas sp. TaxID=1872403 RepID=UPI003D9B2729